MQLFLGITEKKQRIHLIPNSYPVIILMYLSGLHNTIYPDLQKKTAMIPITLVCIN
jgi:hypothetical protein